MFTVARVIKIPVHLRRLKRPLTRPDMDVFAFQSQVTKMLMISPTGKEVPIGQTLKSDEYIGMTRYARPVPVDCAHVC